MDKHKQLVERIMCEDKIEFIAAVQHIGWVTCQIAAGQPYNDKPTDDQHKSLIDNVKFMLENPDITLKENYDANSVSYRLAVELWESLDKYDQV